ncbi:MAG: S41 family peptidase [Flavobacteriales bacterium]
MQNKHPLLVTLSPILIGVSLAIGYILGNYNTNEVPLSNKSDKNELLKINQVIDEINLKYVDTVDRKKLIDQTITGMLYKLDPHSAYIPIEDVVAANESLKGEFGGVGVKFMLLRDTIMVTNVLPYMPAEKFGLKPGDRIIEIDGENVASAGISNDSIMAMLKGKPKTEVRVKVYRPLGKSTHETKIIRDIISINSIEAAFMLSKNTAFIKLVRFSEYTDREFAAAAANLRNKGATKFILDLRGNGGGYLGTAVSVADEFLKSGALIVYTEGKSQPRKNYYATGRGFLEDVEVVVLIDQNSASASEIVAGAIQDNDRGLVIGRRSFGKGLVQQPVNLFDGSEIRLTVSRYYTPSGRSIQKPYGEDVDYESEYYNRYESGELYTLDSSIYKNAEKFKTLNGRTVYGGGGVIPDIFIPADSNGASVLLSTINYLGIFPEFCFDAVFSGKYKIPHTDNVHEFVNRFKVSDKMVDDLLLLAQQNGVHVKTQELNHSKERIKQRIKTGIAGNLFDNEGIWLAYSISDKDIKEALKSLGEELKLSK